MPTVDRLKISLAALLMIAALGSVRLMAGEIVDPDVRHVHDPTMIYDGSYAYVYSTGMVDIRRSNNLLDWQYAGRVFSSIPQWIKDRIPGVSNLWAPDVTYHNGRYYLCYSASTFGSQTSLIALASNATLNPASSNYHWVDEGEVISSPPGTAPQYNAIDGTFVKDANGGMWLVFGSFWDGIMLTPLDSSTLKPTTSPPTIYNIARRQTSPALEAAYIKYRNGYYYLFVNFDACCEGVNSTYKIMVGRSASITGPYYDKAGVSMLAGGGTLFVGTDGRWIGPGHATITAIGGQDFFSYHVYDAQDGGTPTLRINELNWDQSLWPVLGDPVIRTTADPTPPQGPTVAHWNFEDGTPGTPLNNTGSIGRVGTTDRSVNGFGLYAYDTNYGPAFSSEGQTPSGVGLSARFDGGQDGYTRDAGLNVWSPTEWTIEFAAKLDTLSGWQTIIGRDGSAHGEAEANFYFQKNDVNDRFSLNFETAGGQRYVLHADFTVQTGRWYYMAAVCDGSTLTMYADKLDGRGPQAVGTLALNTANDNALAYTSSAQSWTIGRGWFNGSQVDHVRGNIDDVRFSDRALLPSEFVQFQCGAKGYPSSDLDWDCTVDLPDFALLAGGWDGTLASIAALASEWLQNTLP